MLNKLQPLAAFLLLTTSCSTGQPVESTIQTVITRDLVEAEIHFLASDELRGRDTGSPEQLIAAKFIAAQMQSWGVNPHPKLGDYLQQVPLELYYPPASASIGFKGSIETEDILVWGGGNGKFSGQLLMMGLGLEKDYAESAANGKIIVVRTGTPEKPSSSPQDVQRKLELAQLNGAVAVIELTTLPAAQWAFYKGYLGKQRIRLKKDSSTSIPYIWWNDTNQEIIGSLKDADGSDAMISLSGSSNNNIESNNVIGYLEGTDPSLKDEIVVLSAHYDHVGVGKANMEGDSIFNGARDNAVGVVSVLSAAKALAERPAKRSYLFVFFTGEEKGMLGSKHFIDNAPVPLDQIVFNMNNDNAGYNDKSIATVVGLSRTNTKQLFEEGCAKFGLKAVEDPAPEQNLFDRSDNVQFAAKGIPAPTFSLGFTGFDAEIGKHYHQASDNPETLDYEYLTSFFRSFAYTAYLIGNRTEKPFWVEGDKYYEAGKKLYEENPTQGSK